MSFDSFDIAWIAVDWGTTNFRAYALDNNRDVLGTIETADGMNSISGGEFESTLIQLIHPWLTEHVATPVIMSGMVGAKQGWSETPYREVPCAAPSSSDIVPIQATDSRIQCFIAPGVCQLKPADVMRGEETQIFGYLLANPSFSGLVCLPGTHSKWVEVSDGTVQRFRTWMTGEIFSLLTKRSVLQHSVQSNDWNQAAFLYGAGKSLEANADVFGSLFSIRAADLLHETGGAVCKSTLSGLLIGAECTAALGWASTPEQSIAIVGANSVSELYVDVLTQFEQDITQVNVTQATLAGLHSLAASLLRSETGV